MNISSACAAGEAASRPRALMAPMSVRRDNMVFPPRLLFKSVWNPDRALRWPGMERSVLRSQTFLLRSMSA